MVFYDKLLLLLLLPLLVGHSKVKSAYEPKWPIRPELIPVSYHEATRNIAIPPWMGC